MAAQILNPIELKQRRASDPTAFSFVAANAGSGKTYVLVKRILRILLNGNDPSSVLALTYTTAAATNMSNRVFRELSRWVSLGHEELYREIYRIEGTEPNSDRLKLARQLFARSIETPGGLKIQTIHAFCERILHLFPFEANVPANFAIMDDRLRGVLLTNARNVVLNNYLLNIDPCLSEEISKFIEITGEHGFEPTIKMAISFLKKMGDFSHNYTEIDNLISKISQKLKLDEFDTEKSIINEIYDGRLSNEECISIGDILLNSSTNDKKIGKILIDSAFKKYGDEWKNAYYSAFITLSGEARSDRSFLSKAFRENFPILFRKLLLERDRIVRLLDILKSLDSLSRTRAMLTVTSAVLQAYEKEKIQHGVLDFDDLINRTRDLLNCTSAQWILYKLDRGFNHVLIDEAQDTSPEQWEIIKLLTAEFYSGESSNLNNRTVFAVGDPKQSIYSFQGAAPKAFSKNKEFFKRQFDISADVDMNIGKINFYDEKLLVSFRSSREILKAVDMVFNIPSHYEGLDSSFEPTVHESQRDESPGLVEIWPLIEPEKFIEIESWSAPLDKPSNGNTAVRLAKNMASHISRITDVASKEFIQDQFGVFRSIVPGDILILVRKRGILFEAIIRALKEIAIPVAGADRLKLNDHIAVMDLVALGKFIITPTDDLNLACVLRSPLIGFTEHQLFDLAVDREGSLIDALLIDSLGSEFNNARSLIKKYIQGAKGCGPFTFYSYVLGPCGGRRNFKSRLGSEADDALDEFLRLALDYEQNDDPSLSLFLDKFVSSDLTVKRDMESDRNEVRVMTVHGAKGLEAPVVYLPDTSGAAVDTNHSITILNLDESDSEFLPIWSPSQSMDSEVIAGIRENNLKREAEENRRLLYVAMTRARDRLYVAGYLGKRGLPSDSWYAMIDRTLGPDLIEVNDEISPPGARRMQTIPYPENLTNPLPADAIEPIDVPDWLMQDAIDEHVAQGPLNPSAARKKASEVDNIDSIGIDELSRRRGILIHSLLEFLPKIIDYKRFEVASEYLEIKAPDFDAESRCAMIRSICQILSEPKLMMLFAENSRAELPISGILRREGFPPRRVSGKIDRLAAFDEEILIADFKTSLATPASVNDIAVTTLAQLAIYGALVGDMYPNRKIRCFVIYTEGPVIFELPDELLKDSLSLIE